MTRGAFYIHILRAHFGIKEPNAELYEYYERARGMMQMRLFRFLKLRAYNYTYIYIMDKVFNSMLLAGGVCAALLSFFAGYRYGEKISDEQMAKVTAAVAAVTTTTAVDHNNIDDDDNIGELYHGHGNNFKMVVVAIDYSKVGKGQMVVRCSHAALGAYQRGVYLDPRLVRQWEKDGSTKIIVKVNSEEEMMAVFRAACDKSLNICLMKNVMAIGPAPVHEIDQVTGRLSLL